MGLPYVARTSVSSRPISCVTIGHKPGLETTAGPVVPDDPADLVGRLSLHPAVRNDPGAYLCKVCDMYCKLPWRYGPPHVFWNSRLGIWIAALVHVSKDHAKAWSGRCILHE
jgi:hypothetical protein